MDLPEEVEAVAAELPECFRCGGLGFFVEEHRVCATCQGFGRLVDIEMAGVLYLTACRAADRRMRREGKVREQLKRCEDALAIATGKERTPYQQSLKSVKAQLQRTINTAKWAKDAYWELHRETIELRKELAELRSGSPSERSEDMVSV